MAVNRVTTLLGISALSHRGLGPKSLILLSRAVGSGVSMEVFVHCAVWGPVVP